MKKRVVLHLDQSQVTLWFLILLQACFSCRISNASTPEPKALRRPPTALMTLRYYVRGTAREGLSLGSCSALCRALGMLRHVPKFPVQPP